MTLDQDAQIPSSLPLALKELLKQLLGSRFQCISLTHSLLNHILSRWRKRPLVSAGKH
mgnify:CR=1 FL=1